MTGAREPYRAGHVGREPSLHVAAGMVLSRARVPATGAGLREGTRPGWDEGPYAFMRRVLSSEAGHELYKHRKATVEPVFAQNKFNRGFRRFQRRGRSAVRSEWRLQAAVHNLPKLHNHWIDPAIA